MIFYINQFIGGIKFRRFLEKGVIKKTDMYHRLYFAILLSVVKPVKRAAQVDEGAVLPVHLIGNLHFQIDQGMVIEKDIDIKAEFFVIDSFAQNDRVSK